MKRIAIIIVVLMLFPPLFAVTYERNDTSSVYPDKLSGKGFKIVINPEKKTIQFTPVNGTTSVTMKGNEFGTINLSVSSDGFIDYDSLTIFFCMNTAVDAILYSKDNTIIAAASFKGLGDDFKLFCSGGYPIGSIGPAGGIVFYDKGDYANSNWRYLEASPSDLRILSDGTPCIDESNPLYKYGDPNCIWGYYRPNPDAPISQVVTKGLYKKNAIGSGKKNTETIVSTIGDYAFSNGDDDYSYETKGTTSIYAAKLCWDLTYNGFSDWFLPSEEELKAIYNNLHLAGLGDFYNSYYWTSTESGYANSAIVISFESGESNFGVRGAKRNRVRPIRAF